MEISFSFSVMNRGTTTYNPQIKPAYKEEKPGNRGTMYSD